MEYRIRDIWPLPQQEKGTRMIWFNGFFFFFVFFFFVFGGGGGGVPS